MAATSQDWTGTVPVGPDHRVRQARGRHVDAQEVHPASHPSSMTASDVGCSQNPRPQRLGGGASERSRSVSGWGEPAVERGGVPQYTKIANSDGTLACTIAMNTIASNSRCTISTRVNDPVRVKMRP